ATLKTGDGGADRACDQRGMRVAGNCAAEQHDAADAQTDQHDDCAVDDEAPAENANVVSHDRGLYGAHSGELRRGNMLGFRQVLQSSSKGGLPQMRHLVAATAVVGFLATGLACAQMKSAVPPGTASSPHTTAATPLPVAQAPSEEARRITREEAIK